MSGQWKLMTKKSFIALCFSYMLNVVMQTKNIFRKRVLQNTFISVKRDVSETRQAIKQNT